MAMIPIPYPTLLTIMQRIRAGEGLYTVARAMHIDPERLRRQLRSRFADFEGLMRAHSGHKVPRLVITAPAPHEPKRVKRGPKGRGFRDVHFEKRMEPERALAFTEARARGMRLRDDFSAEELEALRVKLAGWLARGEGQPAY